LRRIPVKVKSPEIILAMADDRAAGVSKPAAEFLLAVGAIFRLNSVSSFDERPADD
jgi:hypothetical protein